jgi:signal transduction histidine kinase
VTFVNEQAAIGAIYATSQRRIWQALSLALAASLAIGFVATRHAGRLQDHVAEQRTREIQTRRELQQLSARLLTAHEEERRTIARELHDEVGQVLTAIKMELAVAENTLTANGNDADVLRTARAVTDSALHTVRDLSHLLHPAMLDDLGLPETIAWYAKGFSDRHRLPVSFVQDQITSRMSPEVESSAYRIVQEALTNIAKHSRSRSATVRLSRAGDRLTIVIEDYGIGFNVKDVSLRPSVERGLGLIGIRERVAQLRGTLTLDTAVGRGTKLTVELPVGEAPLAAV